MPTTPRPPRPSRSGPGRSLERRGCCLRSAAEDGVGVVGVVENAGEERSGAGTEKVAAGVVVVADAFAAAEVAGLLGVWPI